MDYFRFIFSTCVYIYFPILPTNTPKRQNSSIQLYIVIIKSPKPNTQLSYNDNSDNIRLSPTTSITSTVRTNYNTINTSPQYLDPDLNKSPTVTDSQCQPLLLIMGTAEVTE